MSSVESCCKCIAFNLAFSAEEMAARAYLQRSKAPSPTTILGLTWKDTDLGPLRNLKVVEGCLLLLFITVWIDC